MTLIWLVSPQYVLALLPYGIYSTFHVLTYTRTHLIHVRPPAKAGAKPHWTAELIGNFIKEYYDASMGLVAILEILLWSRILLSAIAFTKGSWILIALYTAFLRARFAQSTYVRGQFRQFEAYMDHFIGEQVTLARVTWDIVKATASTFHNISDFSN